MRKLVVLAALLLLPSLAFGQTAVKVFPVDTVQSACSLDALNATCQVSLVGKSSAGFIVTAISSPSGISLVSETSRDGTNWDGHRMVDMDNGDMLFTVPNASLAVGYTKSVLLGGGVRYMRIRVSAYTSGSVTVAVTGTDTTGPPWFPTIGNSVKPTYTVCSGALANTASSSAIECESGSSKGHYVRALWVPQPGLQTTAGNRVLTFRRVTTAGSGGTGVTPQPADPNDAAFTGSCRTKGTAGTTGTVLLTRHMWVPTAVANLANPLPIWPPYALAPGGTTLKDVLIPAGTANGWEVNDPGATGGSTMYICVAITEE